MTTVYVPRDSAALSVGADEVAIAIATSAATAGREINLVRNGSRGLLWLEPLVEVETARGRVAYGPVAADEVDDLIRAGMLDGAATDHSLGPIEEHEWLRGQTRVTFARVGVIDPLSPEDYEAHGGLRGLRAALAKTPEQVVEDIISSGLRGRGGAGFPAGIKWKTVLEARADVKFVCCNADEGDSGTFADRMLMEGDPFTLIEGMTIAAYATGATEGFVYVRSEYPDAIATLRRAIEIAYARGWLGTSILGGDTSFDLHVRVGAGAYICGEETSMLESLEGKRGVVRAKPPIPALEGLFGRPTVVNNVLTLGSAPMILADGAAAYQGFGVGRSRGTQVFQLGGNVARGGIVELPFGVTLGELVNGYGGGTRTGRPVRAVQVGGPLGAYLPVERFDLEMDYERFAEAGAMVGHGGIVVFDDTVDMAWMARFAMEFCAIESCGKCTPCRVGAVRGRETIDKIIAGADVEANLVLLDDLCELMTDGSLCAMGGLTPMPVRSAVRHFPGDFRRSTPPPMPHEPGSRDEPAGRPTRTVGSAGS
ncbi:MAG TPA: NADH-ubiquinone oxidoreductase-F iron-sulfur binding region domain-containing protein [Streptosporangiaceae bacterium]|nr:NADH-ubiquinone oxidoreductase-F iron-sulfur binding region domain-containing protein [Streptosporangiaceae bacterium]